MRGADFHAVIHAAKLLGDYDRPWAVCGGWGIHLFLIPFRHRAFQSLHLRLFYCTNLSDRKIHPLQLSSDARDWLVDALDTLYTGHV